MAKSYAHKRRYYFLYSTGLAGATLHGIMGLREAGLMGRLLAFNAPDQGYHAPPLSPRGVAHLEARDARLLYTQLSGVEADNMEIDEVYDELYALLLKQAKATDTADELEAHIKRMKVPEWPEIRYPTEAKEKPEVSKDKPSDIQPHEPPKRSVTGLVWEIADELVGSLGRRPTNAEIIKACIEEGINKGTASVQAGKWGKARY